MYAIPARHTVRSIETPENNTFRLKCTRDESGAYLLQVLRKNNHGGHNLDWVRVFPNIPSLDRYLTNIESTARHDIIKAMKG